MKIVMNKNKSWYSNWTRIKCKYIPFI